MKTALQTLALIAALGMTTLAAWSQQTPSVTQTSTGPNSPNIAGVTGSVTIPPTVKQLSPEARELAITKVKLAIATAQLAGNNAQAAQSASQQAVVQAQQLIEQTRIELGLDDTWAWDFQRQDFVKKPAPAATPPPAAPAPPKK